MASLKIELVDYSSIEPNDWNPNKQNERALAAEKESILDHGFIVPVTVRPHPTKSKTYQIIDGFHRWKVIGDVIANNLEGNGNIAEIVKTKQIPVVVLDVDDANAKRLTIILNETRGRADMGELAILLGDLQTELGDDLIRGLPYSQGQLNELLSLSEFDWNSLEILDDEDVLPTEEEHTARIVALLSSEAETLWEDFKIQNAASLPKDEKKAAGKLIEMLLSR